MKKFISIFIAIFIVFTLLYGVSSSFAFTNFHWFTVEVSPLNAGNQAAYHMYGGVSDYNGVDSMIMYLQWTYHLHDRPSPKTVTVNGVEVLSVSMEEVPEAATTRTNLKIIILLKQTINKNESIDIKISRDAGIINPYEPRPCYQISTYLLRNGIQLGYIGSEQYTITQSAVSTPEVTVEPAIKGMNAEYIISFSTGVNGSLQERTDDIRIKFPNGTKFPSSLFAKYISINGVQCISGVYRDTNDPTILVVYTPVEVKTKTPVTVFIGKGFGLINTSDIGMQTLYISTYREPDWVESAPFNIASPMVQNLNISLGSDVITMSSSIHIGFTTSPVGSLMKGKSIYINFPDGFAFPELIDSSFVTVNGKNADTEVFGKKVIIHAPENIGNNADVVVEISDEAHIANPISFGDYEIEVYTDNDSYAAVATVSITQSSVKNVVLNALYSGTETKNEFNITFTTGLPGELTSGIDYVKVYFGNAFELPETVEEGIIFINDIPVNNVSIDVYSVVATVPLDIEPNSEVKVKIPVDFGIRNPDEVGDYVLKVSTSKETAAMESNTLTIVLLPVVEFIVVPSNPDGENGIYKSKPNVQLSTSNGGEVHFKVDDGEFLLYGGQSIVVQEGEHKIFAYASDGAENKGDVQEISFKVDNTSPTITFDQGSGNIYVNDTHAVLSGKVSEPCELKINGIVVTVGNDLSFSVELDVTDKSSLTIYAKDIAGNSVPLVRTVYLDKKVPVITMLFPGREQYSTADETVQIRLKLNEEGAVTINSKEMDFDGSVFNMTVNLYNGENNFYVEATDLAGNKTTKNITISRINEIVITLQIGSDIAYVGSEMKTLDAAPIIQNNRTLVPLRFIMEALGAVVTWNGDLQIIIITHKTHTIQLQIGSSLAWIDGSDVKTLDTAPIIQSERTLVPLRFIMETFGATVDWEDATKTITIIYTP